MQHGMPVPVPEAETLSCSATVSNLGQQRGQSQLGGRCYCCEVQTCQRKSRADNCAGWRAHLSGWAKK
eukprot:2979746-Rhodomonas_salina.1